MSSTRSTTDVASIISSVSKTSSKADPVKSLWCQTQWSNLSMQAKKLDLPTLPYFDPDTMLLSKEVNSGLWKRLRRLYDFLGPDRAPYATPIMIEGGEVKWHSFLDGEKGQEVEVYDHSIDAFMNEAAL